MNRHGPLDDSLGDHFSRRDALEVGASPARLRAHDLEIRFRGARSRIREPGTASDDKWARAREELIDLCTAYQTVAPRGFAFSHTTAAALHGLPLPRAIRPGFPLHVTVLPGVRAPRRVGVVGHTGRFVAVRGPAGLPVVEPVTAWLQLSPCLTLDELVIAGDALVRRKRPLATLLALEACVASSGGVRGIRLAGAALADVRSGTDSPPESELRLVLVRAGLPEPVVHYEVLHDGYFVGTPDLAYVEQRIAIEYQGPQHWEDRSVFEDDIIRRELFKRAGWHVLLVTGRRLRASDLLVEEVRALLAERAPRH